MTLFKNKVRNESAIIIELKESYSRAKEKNQNSFYFSFFDKELPEIECFCKKNNLFFTLDHKTDNNLIYKFYINGR